ncbi:MAG: CotH kinase family protein [Flavobacteriales bacterium]
MNRFYCLLVLSYIFVFSPGFEGSAQVVINEGSNRNFQTVVDEDGEAEDWIELYNMGNEAVDLFGYQLTTELENASELEPWTFPHYTLQPGEHLLIFCSEKNRIFSPPFEQVAFISDYTPFVGWNTHEFSQDFIWDGVSDIVVNSCSYSNTGYISNAVFNQTETPYISSTVTYNDGSDASCYGLGGEVHASRPNIQLNGISIGDGTLNNSTTSYPAPYGNWYWSARNQMLYKGSELLAAGLTAGPISSIAWDVTYTDNVLYTYVDIALKQVSVDGLTPQFINNSGVYFHTDFRIASEGEVVYLIAPDGNTVDELNVNVPATNSSVGLFEDGIEPAVLLQTPSPGATNNNSALAVGVAESPLFSIDSGVYPSLQSVIIYDLNTGNSQVYYTTNGEEPTQESTLYDGENIPVFQSTVIRARAYKTGMLPSAITSATYLINVDHSTPIVSVMVDPEHLYGPEGIFDNWGLDWERYAQMMYFDSTTTHPLLFERQTAMQIDGGAGGSRAHPQHSFRLELAKGSLNENPVLLPLLPNRPEREQYSRLYFRNGSNQWLTMPWKDGCQVEMMTGESKGYFSAMRPVTVYINGQYFGLYEMREKLDEEMFTIYDQSIPDDVLSLSYWYQGQLRATTGDPMNYWMSLEQFFQLDPLAPNFLELADAIFDMEYYADYIIGQSWIGNADWPQNNIKAHRSDSTFNRWRFSTIDMELSLAPNGWTDCYFEGLGQVYGAGQDQPFVGPWIRSMNNEAYRQYFINRYADLLNTSYRIERLLAMSDNYFERWAPEMPNEYQRWGDPGNVNGWMNELYDRHLAFQADLECKSGVIRDQIQNRYELEGQFTLTLDVEPAGAGYIQINTITPQDLPWDGIYYNGVPIEITAFANEGYEFQFWEDNLFIGNVNIPTWSGPINLEEINFTAVFEEVVGVNETAANTSSAMLYPNPVSSVLQLENKDKRMNGYEIYASDGRLIHQDQMGLSQYRWNLDVSGYSNGIYTIKIKYLDGDAEVLRWVKD